MMKFRNRLLEKGIIDKDRIAGPAKEIKGAVKEVAGGAKLELYGTADKIEGKV